MAVKRDEMRPIAGSERPQAPRSTLLGPEDAATHITVTLLLRQRPGSPEPPDLQHWQDTPPDRRQFLSANEFDELYGGAEEDVEAVVDYLRSKDLRILDKHAGQRRVVAEGTRAEIDAAFAIKLQRYRVPHRVAHRRHLHGEGHQSSERITIEQHDHRGFEGPVKCRPRLSTS
jgi:hypothetical protein